MTQNPLEKHYRHKTFYTSLPSGGNHYPSGIKLSADGEIGIMPMTAADEIKLKTPDALFNGEAVYSLLRSCIPDIANPEEIPVSDVDKLLIGIRVATQGKYMDINSKCPECEKEETYSVDITAILNSAKKIEAEKTLVVNSELSVILKPYTLRNQIRGQIESFFQERMRNMIENRDMDEQAKLKAFNEALVGAIAVQTNQVADCIEKVLITDNDDVIEVTERDHIFQWVENMESATHAKISDRITELSDSQMSDKVKICCSNIECNDQYQVTVSLDPVNFFLPRQ